MRVRAASIASAAVVVAAIALLLAFDGSETSPTQDEPGVRERERSLTTPSKPSPRGAIADCSTRSEASFPGAFTNPANLIVGPLVLVDASGTADFVRDFGGNKFPLLVKRGHRVTLEIPRRVREAGLAYGPLPGGKVRLRDAHRVVTFIACRRGEHPGNAPAGSPVTFWSGGVLAGSPMCVPLRVWVNNASSPLRAVLHLGVSRCT